MLSQKIFAKCWEMLLQVSNLERLPELLPAGADLLRREEEPEAVVAQLSREHEAGALQRT